MDGGCNTKEPKQECEHSIFADRLAAQKTLCSCTWPPGATSRLLVWLPAAAPEQLCFIRVWLPIWLRFCY